MQVVLISTYELGRQPFGLASPLAWLRQAGAEAIAVDLAVEPSDTWHTLVDDALLVAFYVPMHTATRLAVDIIKQVQQRNPKAHLCCYGLYAPLNEPFLRQLGVHTILGGEFEQGLVDVYRRVRDGVSSQLGEQPEDRISLAKQTFIPPDRQGLPGLTRYAHVQLGQQQRVVGYTEASRGCKHLCRHCPVVPVYNGRFRVIARDVVLADIRQQVAAGAQHITFGDPDFLNGPGHALPLVQALHGEFPDVTYDVTIKVEHLLRYADHLPTLRDTGCLFVTSAVEAVDDSILKIFDKRHITVDFKRAVGLLREVGLTLNPTFVAFTPWTTRRGYIQFLETIEHLELVDHVAPIQYAIRLLLPAGSKLLDVADVRALVGAFDQAALSYPWSHPDPSVDQLQAAILKLVGGKEARHRTRREVFEQVRRLAVGNERPVVQLRRTREGAGAHLQRLPIPQLSEPWYC
jgi:radical SAM superfamily enzyme YgiQ (UPF0313 family)